MDNTKLLTEIKRYEKGKSDYITDVVVRERSFVIGINSRRLVQLAYLPEYKRELAWGFLFSEGIILEKSEIIGAELGNDFINLTVQIPDARLQNFHQSGEKTSGCGSALSAQLENKTAQFIPLRLNADSILSTMTTFHKQAKLFLQTGGVHSAALVKERGIIYYAEDIGRHNAVDKVAGMALLEDCPLSEMMLFTSGRISSEIAKKAIRLKIPLIVSGSAPTSEAIRLGWRYGLYLIGFARGKRFSIYTGFDDIKLEL
jgi:FdhD protein